MAPPDHPKQQFSGEQSLTEPNIYVSLTYDPLDATAQMARVKSPQAGAVVLFAGTTRSHFSPSRPITHLSYTTYPSLALRTLLRLSTSILTSHSLTSIAITHRLGRVDIGEESILIAVSAPHRREAWRGGEEALERVKGEVEVWKEEWFEDGGVWRANRDGGVGVEVRRGSGSGSGGTKGSGGSGKGSGGSGARKGSDARKKELPEVGIRKRGTGEFSEGGLEF
ncbi:unnamed protein product [Zymoseptoria tritici ST99CH_3D7]|uniref:Molybdopterin synthase catalytic subunit n=1 Tax=Zymoseptoria tritici (strain ST99CH_3D7) TaxID=1276538 RepID=A0A1X7S9M8_ZYMT9|nr:unnamed protein product [Zymoseptoria tritici ST99CH_3D7]